MKFDIAIATDSNYIVPTTVLLKSLFQNNRDIDFTVNILYLVESLDLKDLTWLESYIVSNGQKVRKLPVTSEDLGRVPDCRHTKSTFLRLLLPDLMPANIEIVLYLDSDIIVNGSIKELLMTRLDNYCVAGVKESINVYDKSYLSKLGIPTNCYYFNAGVLLMNLIELRKRDACKLFFAYLKNNMDVIKANDQDVLNGTLYESVKYISPIYNYNFWIEKDVSISLFSKDIYKEVWNNPVIIHYIGPIKPWNYLSMHPKKRLWWSYLELTPFSAFKPVQKTTINVLKYPIVYIISHLKRNCSYTFKRNIGRFIPAQIKHPIKNLFLRTQ